MSKKKIAWLARCFAILKPKQKSRLLDYVESGKKFLCGKHAMRFVRNGLG